MQDSMFQGVARTNAFRVKDADAFRTWADNLGLVVREVSGHIEGRRFALYPGSLHDDGLFPTMQPAEDGEGDVEVDYAKELSAHLAEGEFAFMVHCFNEGSDHLGGAATAIAWDGRSLSVSTDDIYRMTVEMLQVQPERLTLAYEDGARNYSDFAGKTIFPAPRKPVPVIVAFGSDVIRAINERRQITVAESGCVVAIEFETVGEAEAYLQGVSDRDVWDTHEVISAIGAEHPYFDAEEENPTLQFEDWHNRQVDKAN